MSAIHGLRIQNPGFLSYPVVRGEACFPPSATRFHALHSSACCVWDKFAAIGGEWRFARISALMTWITRRAAELRFRAQRRGFKEVDLIFGAFAEAHLAGLDEAGLDRSRRCWPRPTGRFMPGCGRRAGACRV